METNGVYAILSIAIETLNKTDMKIWSWVWWHTPLIPELGR
jgi:hypothetical protein